MKKSNYLKLIILLITIVLIGCEKEEVPIASFTMDKTSAGTGETISFTNTSENATSYVWDFGDGNTSTDENPIYSYSVGGDFTITLTATGSGGTNSTTKTITISLIPENGEWVGNYTGRSTADGDISFYINDGIITDEGSTIEFNMAGSTFTVSMFVNIYFSGVTITRFFYNDIQIDDASFEFTHGQVTSSGGKITVTGTFTSFNECEGTVTFDENSYSGSGHANFSYTAVR
ncbi:PKD domain-containing protein [Bacteroidota bacterium]